MRDDNLRLLQSELSDNGIHLKTNNNSLIQRINPFGIFKSDSGDKKPPKGFEKFFKKKEDREKEAPTSSKGTYLNK